MVLKKIDIANKLRKLLRIIFYFISEGNQVGEIHFKRKRTAFDQKQYQVLEVRTNIGTNVDKC